MADQFLQRAEIENPFKEINCHQMQQQKSSKQPLFVLPFSNTKKSSRIDFHKHDEKMSVSGDCLTVVELAISCRSGPDDANISSKTESICIVHQKASEQDNWQEIGRTKISWNSTMADFSTRKVPVGYLFEERQFLKFEVFIWNLHDFDFVGSVEVSLGEIVASTCQKAFERKLDNNASDSSLNKGSVIRVMAKEVPSCKEVFSVKLYADRLPTSYFRTNRFFFEIQKSTEAAGFALVFRSETVQAKGDSVDWPEFKLNKYSLCNDDIDLAIVVSLFKFKRNNSHRLIGQWNTSVRYLTENCRRLPVAYKLSSHGPFFRLVRFAYESVPSFLDFIIVGGVRINCFLAIDFTASNGNPTRTNSLHHIDPSNENQYQIALKGVAEIIQDYDADKSFSVLGFGAKVPPEWRVSHKFFVNFHPTNPSCLGVDGVMAAYADALEKVRFHGPTNFAPIINHVSRYARERTDGRNYFILLIITDGVICDMPQTINSIVAASCLPMSIIIVGVGSADFSAMEVLDGGGSDKPLVDSQGQSMKRDIVQFVPFNEVIQKCGKTRQVAGSDIAREVLFDVPSQLLSYMKANELTPDSVVTPNKKNAEVNNNNNAKQ